MQNKRTLKARSKPHLAMRSAHSPREALSSIAKDRDISFGEVKVPSTTIVKGF